MCTNKIKVCPRLFYQLVTLLTQSVVGSKAAPLFCLLYARCSIIPNSYSSRCTSESSNLSTSIFFFSSSRLRKTSSPAKRLSKGMSSVICLIPRLMFMRRFAKPRSWALRCSTLSTASTSGGAGGRGLLVEAMDKGRGEVARLFLTKGESDPARKCSLRKTRLTSSLLGVKGRFICSKLSFVDSDSLGVSASEVPRVVTLK